MNLNFLIEQFSIVETLRKFFNLNHLFNLILISKDFHQLFSKVLLKNQSILKKWNQTDETLKKLTQVNEFSINSPLLQLSLDNPINFPSIGIIVHFASLRHDDDDDDDDDFDTSHIILSSNHKKNSICIPLYHKIREKCCMIFQSNRFPNTLGFLRKRKTLYELNVEEFLATQQTNWSITQNYSPTNFSKTFSNCRNYSFKRRRYSDNVIIMKNTKKVKQEFEIPPNLIQFINKEVDFNIVGVYGDVHTNENLISMVITFVYWRSELIRLICFLLRVGKNETKPNFEWEIRNDIILSEAQSEEFDLNCSAIYCTHEDRFEILTQYPNSPNIHFDIEKDEINLSLLGF